MTSSHLSPPTLASRSSTALTLRSPSPATLTVAPILAAIRNAPSTAAISTTSRESPVRHDYASTTKSPVSTSTQPSRSTLAKAPKPPRRNVLKRTAFLDDTLDVVSPMSTGQPATAVSDEYDSLISTDLCQLVLHRDHVSPEVPAASSSPDLLPPPFGTGYICPLTPNISPFELTGSRVIFSVDSRCEPFNIIRRDVMMTAGLLPFHHPTRLALGDLDKTVHSDEMVAFQLRIVINDRPRMFVMRCVVWNTLAGELIISNQTALAYGLTIFCHSQTMREAIIGREALSTGDECDSVGDVPASMASIFGPDDDQEIMDTISPIESLRQAMSSPDDIKDPWVAEELRGPRAAVFGPLPPEPANVPPLEFDVDEDALRQRTYGNTQPVRLPPSSPHGQDVIDAQWDELKRYNVLVDAFPHIGPGPIANIAFTVAKPGVIRVKRPPGFIRNSVPSDPSAALTYAAYVESLTADRVVVNFGPSNEFITVQHFAMPSVQENLAKLSKFKYWSKIDIVKAYWGIPVHRRCWKWLYTIAPGGKAGYWIRAPMGCAPVCAWFQYVIQGVLQHEADFTLCYADDIMVGANDLETLRNHNAIVLQRILDAGFRLNPKKCQLFPADEIKYLGWILRDGKIYPGENCLTKLAAIQKPITPLSKQDDGKAQRQAVRRFLGLILYLGAYIPFHAEQLRPLHDLTRTRDSTDDPVSVAQRALPPTAKKVSVPRKFKWTPEADAAWDWAVEQIRHIKPLYAPTYAPGTWLATYSDASKKGWGGILVEYRKGDPRPYIICCVSGAFVGAQLKWSTNSKECYGLYKTVSKCRVYLHLHQFVMNVDHRNLIWMAVSVNDMIVRMATALQQHRYLIKHCSGDRNVAADILSRDFPDVDESPPTDIDKLNRELVDTDETVAPSELISGISDMSDSEMMPISGSVMPVAPAPLPILPHQRQGDPPPRQRRQARVRRQPDAPLDIDVNVVDDGLPVFDVGPHSPPPPRRISTEHYHILKSFHGGANPHTGIEPLLRALREHGYNWEDMDNDVRHFVSTCHACQLERLRRRGPTSLPYRSIIIPTRMFDVWTFDILGPLEPCVLTGSKWVHIGIEETSKIIMLGHSVSASSLELVFFFLDCFRIFGLPRTIRSDLGPQFISRACENFCQSTGIQHEFGIADRHESDGVVENAASLVWPYLRLAAHDLRKYDAWTPLLCNVQLACNALARDVLGGASASELVFNRKVRPMRFLRPEAMPRVGDEVDPETFMVSNFIADQASMQLRAIHRADNERHMRYRHRLNVANDKADGLEQLDWVREGILVSIPQRDHQTFARPNKWALLRRGPYEVVTCLPGHATVSLVDVNARFRRDEARSRPFTYPKVWLHPYTADTEPLDERPVSPPQPQDLPEFALLIETDAISAILQAIPLAHAVIPNAPQHVRNFEYLVRWSRHPHSDNSVEPYRLVWHTDAFAEFIQGSDLIGHVPPTAYALRHRHHVNQLLQRQVPDNDIVPVDPSAVLPGRPLANYMPHGHPNSAAPASQSSQLSAPSSQRS